MAYDTWVGPTYLSGLAGEMAISIGLLSFLTAVPWIGSTGQVLGLWAFRKSRSAKAYTMKAAPVARALWLIPLAIALFWTLRPSAFPLRPWFYLLAITACVSSLFGTSGGASWMSWMSALVPASFRGRFFGVRQIYVMVAVVFAHLLAAIFVDWRWRNLRLGFALVGVLALASALISTLLLARVPEDASEIGMEAEGADSRSFLKMVSEPLMDSRFRRILIFGAAFNGALQTASPFYPYYFIRDLSLSMNSVAFWSVLGALGSAFAASFLGRRIDRVGTGPRTVLRRSISYMALSPLPYIVPSARFIRAIAPPEYALSGIASVGYTLSFATLLLRASPRGRNVAYFSVYTAASGIAGALGNELGGHLALWLQPWGGFRVLWVVASVSRAAVLFGLFPESASASQSP